MKDFHRLAQITNMGNKKRTYHKPFLEQAMVTITNNKEQWKVNKLEKEIRKLKATEKVTTETENTDQTKRNNAPEQNTKNGNATAATNRGQ